MTRSTYTTAFLLFTLLRVSAYSIITADATPLLTRMYGGEGLDRGQGIQRTADGGLILAGLTTSYGAGAEDFYLIKTDAAGNVAWDATYGGAARDLCNDVAQTSDGGYILAGYTGVGPTEYNAYVVRADAQGNFLWDKNFGVAGRNEFNAVRETPDGGFILCGDKAGGSLYLVKIDAAGNLLWQRTYGGGDDHGEAIEVTLDGGFVIGGWRGDGSTFPEFDAWVLRTNSGGSIVWQKTLDSSIDDRVYAVVQTSDGGFAAAGHIGGGMALWRLGEFGGLKWQRVYGGPSSDYANDMVETADNGFLLGGNTTRNSQWEQYLVKTDAAGVLESEEIIGDVRWEFCWAIDVTSDGNYAVFGSTNTTPGYDYDWYLTLVEGPDSPSGIGDVPSLAASLQLRVAPNPIKFDTEFSFEMPEAGHARLAIYDIRGARVATVLNGHIGAGDQSVFWSPRSAGSALASGIYFVRLEAGGRVETRKFVIAK